MSSTGWSGATTAWGTRVLLWEHTDIGGYNARCWLDAHSDMRAVVAFVETNTAPVAFDDANTALDAITAFARWGSR